MQDCFRYVEIWLLPDFREHPEVYKTLDEDELDDTSAEAIETATTMGEETLKEDERKGESKGNDSKKEDKKKAGQPA